MSTNQRLEKPTRTTYPKRAPPPQSNDLEIDVSNDRAGEGLGSVDAAQEILARSRRIETRLTSLLVAMGVANGAQKPQFHKGPSVLQVPSPHSSIKECAEAIPHGWSRPVTVMIGEQKLLVISPHTS